MAGLLSQSKSNNEIWETCHGVTQNTDISYSLAPRTQRTLPPQRDGLGANVSLENMSNLQYFRTNKALRSLSFDPRSLTNERASVGSQDRKERWSHHTLSFMSLDEANDSNSEELEEYSDRHVRVRTLRHQDPIGDLLITTKYLVR